MRHLKKINEDLDNWDRVYNIILDSLNTIRDILIDFEDNESIKYGLDGSFRVLEPKGDSNIFLDVALSSLKATLNAGGDLDTVVFISNIVLPGKRLNSESQEILEDILIGIKRMNEFFITTMDFDKEYNSITCILRIKINIY